MFSEEIRIKRGLSLLLFCPLRILYNSKVIIMATFLGTNAVVLTRVHCILHYQIFLGMELTGPSRRRFAGQIGGFFWPIGNLILAGLGYAIRDWTKLQIACATPGVLFLLYWM